jgi:hypothetical protein
MGRKTKPYLEATLSVSNVLDAEGSDEEVEAVHEKVPEERSLSARNQASSRSEPVSLVQHEMSTERDRGTRKDADLDDEIGRDEMSSTSNSHSQRSLGLSSASLGRPWRADLDAFRGRAV